MKFMAKDFLILSYKVTKKIFCVMALLLIFSIWCWPLKISYAQSSGNVNVSAFVESEASASRSSVTIDHSEIVADGSDNATITVTVNDASGNPLNNLRVQPSSNRGAIDTIDPNEANSNIVGEATFTIKSSASGKATISVLVDNAVTLNDTIEITFAKPPSPAPVTITVTIPPMFGMPEHKLTLFKPAQSHENGDALVDQGMEIQLPFAVFLTSGIFLIAQPMLVSMLVLQTVYHRRKDASLMECQTKVLQKDEELMKHITEKNKDNQA